MSARKKGLGRGLDALLGATAAADSGDARRLPIDLLQQSARQPRRNFDQDALKELAESIKAQGVLQPIVARPLDNGKFEIIAGERRWRAAQLAGLREIPATVKELDDQAVTCIALIENIQREDLNPLEQAQGLARLLDEFGMTHSRIAAAVGRSRPTVTNLLRLLELDEEVKKLLGDGKLEMGHARPLLTLTAQQQRQAARRIVKENLPVRDVEELVRRLREKKTGGKGKRPRVDPNTRKLETDLSDKLGAAVTIRGNKSGKGALRIAYDSLEQLDGILAWFNKK